MIKERATKHTLLKVNMMEHNHWGLEDHFPGWFLGSMWIFQGVPVHKNCFRIQSPADTRIHRVPIRMSMGQKHPKKNLFKYITESLERLIYRKLVKPVCSNWNLQNSHHIHLRSAPIGHGWIAACSFRKCVNLFCLGWFAKLQELGIIMIRLTYHQVCPYPSQQNTNDEYKNKRLESLWLWLQSFEPTEKTDLVTLNIPMTKISGARILSYSNY